MQKADQKKVIVASVIVGLVAIYLVYAFLWPRGSAPVAPEIQDHSTAIQENMEAHAAPLPPDPPRKASRRGAVGPEDLK